MLALGHDVITEKLSFVLCGGGYSRITATTWSSDASPKPRQTIYIEVHNA